MEHDENEKLKTKSARASSRNALDGIRGNTNNSVIDLDCWLLYLFNPFLKESICPPKAPKKLRKQKRLPR
jgi:hypothetical protein